MDVRDLVRSHYGGTDLAGHVLAALADAGVEADHLGPADLFPVDQLHAGGPEASRHLLDRVAAGPGTRLLDVGCGIGGTSRMAAVAGADVTGIDLSPAFVEAATTLTERVGLADRARFLTTAGESMPVEDDSFDTSVMVHVGMNVPDKAALFRDVRRVLRPGGAFGIYDQVRSAEGDLTYPLPWAEDERSSFVETVEEYRAHLLDSGFTVVDVEDRTAAAGPPPPGRLDNTVVFGAAFGERIRNNVAATQAGLLRAVLVLARA
jgi:SAM-dependent methyltransferase